MRALLGTAAHFSKHIVGQVWRRGVNTVQRQSRVRFRLVDPTAEFEVQPSSSSLLLSSLELSDTTIYEP